MNVASADLEAHLRVARCVEASLSHLHEAEKDESDRFPLSTSCEFDTHSTITAAASYAGGSAALASSSSSTVPLTRSVYERTLLCFAAPNPVEAVRDLLYTTSAAHRSNLEQRLIQHGVTLTPEWATSLLNKLALSRGATRRIQSIQELDSELTHLEMAHELTSDTRETLAAVGRMILDERAALKSSISHGVWNSLYRNPAATYGTSRSNWGWGDDRAHEAIEGIIQEAFQAVARATADDTTGTTESPQLMAIFQKACNQLTDVVTSRFTARTSKAGLSGASRITLPVNRALRERGTGPSSSRRGGLHCKTLRNVLYRTSFTSNPTCEMIQATLNSLHEHRWVRGNANPQVTEAIDAISKALAVPTRPIFWRVVKSYAQIEKRALWGDLPSDTARLVAVALDDALTTHMPAPPASGSKALNTPTYTTQYEILCWIRSKVCTTLQNTDPAVFHPHLLDSIQYQLVGFYADGLINRRGLESLFQWAEEFIPRYEELREVIFGLPGRTANSSSETPSDSDSSYSSSQSGPIERPLHPRILALRNEG